MEATFCAATYAMQQWYCTEIQIETADFLRPVVDVLVCWQLDIDSNTMHTSASGTGPHVAGNDLCPKKP